MAGLGKDEVKMLTGICPDEKCSTTLFFPQYDSSIECTGCGQRLNKFRIKNVQPVTDHKVALHNMLKNTILGLFKPKKGPDSIKVFGVSSYQCKLLSPLLTRYGMDKSTGKAKLLTEIQDGKSMFDCSVLAGFSFVIEPEHIEVMGYGRDRTGSAIYLRDTLTSVANFNNNEECLIPIHADGDGHCLVHAVSRALIGRVLFWHALRENLKDHITNNLDRYKALFSDFVQDGEWRHIIEECDPKYQPLDGSMGLGNIHIFGLANVLRRPIILLDSLSGIQSSGDYSGVFLPGLCDPEDCKKSGVLNKPLCLAWSSAGRNHYIALVGVKGCCLPCLPPFMIPKVYGMVQTQLDSYIQREQDGSIAIGGAKCLNDKYIQRLIAAMEELFTDIYKVSTSCVADVHQYIYRSSGYVGTDPDFVVDHTQRAVASQQLFRCLTCEALSEHAADPDWFRPGGLLYKLAIETQKILDPTKEYSFPLHGYICKYDDKKNELIPDPRRSQPPQCQFCQGTMMRHVRGDGTPVYHNGDRTKTRSCSTKCQCGYKHYWKDKEYDNIPEMLPLSLDWAGKTVQVTVEWFQFESDPTLNSNVYEIAQNLVEEHYPGEFGSERLTQQIVDRILQLTAKKEVVDVPKMVQDPSEGQGHSSDDAWSPEVASKIILTGRQSKSICKEELTKRATEIELRKRIEAKAPLMQKRHSNAASGITANKPTSKEQPQKQAKTASQSTTSSRTANQVDTGSNRVAPSGEKSPDMPKKVRISTSDRRQITLTLDPNITYSQLQDLIQLKFDIPAEKQKIKYGFPPKLLQPPADDSSEQQPLDIQHGDKLTVEIVGDEKPGTNLVDSEVIWPAEETQRHSWSTFDANAHDQSAHRLLAGLDQLQTSGQGSLDTAILSLPLMASLSGKDVWNYVQGIPHLFSVGGLFYQQVERDVGLSDGKHCTLSILPGKTFRYNAKEGRLELCLEPHGHYAIEPGIENIVLKKGSLDVHGTSTSTTSELEETLSSGSSGIIVNKTFGLPGHATTAQAFPGRGHSLLSGCENIRMPHDLDMTPTRHSHVSPLVASRIKTQAIEEEEGEVTMETEKAEASSDAAGELKQESEFKRIGPGVTILSDDMSNVVNRQTEMFQTLASQIESIARDAKEEEDHPVPNLISEMATERISSPLKPQSTTDEAGSEPMDST